MIRARSVWCRAGGRRQSLSTSIAYEPWPVLLQSVRATCPELEIVAEPSGVYKLGEMARKVGAKGRCAVLVSVSGEGDGRAGSILSALQRGGWGDAVPVPIAGGACTVQSLKGAHSAAQAVGAEWVVGAGSAGVLEVAKGVAWMLGNPGVPVQRALRGLSSAEGVGEGVGGAVAPCILAPTCPVGTELVGGARVMLEGNLTLLLPGARARGVVVDGSLGSSLRKEWALWTGLSVVAGCVEAAAQSGSAQAKRLALQGLFRGGAALASSVENPSGAADRRRMAEASLLLAAARRVDGERGVLLALARTTAARYAVGFAQTTATLALQAVAALEDRAVDFAEEDQRAALALGALRLAAAILRCSHQAASPNVELPLPIDLALPNASVDDLPHAALLHLLQALPPRRFPPPFHTLNLQQHEIDALASDAHADPIHRLAPLQLTPAQVKEILLTS